MSSRWEVMVALTPVVAMATERPRGLGGGWMGGQRRWAGQDGFQVLAGVPG